MKVWWRGRNPDLWGNAKGYNVHNENMLSASERMGLEFAETPEAADVAFQIAVPTTFEPVEGKPNVLFTMYEMDSIPKSWIEPIRKADLIIVPCRHNVALFRRHFDGPIEVCQEGIDPQKFPYIERHEPGPDEVFNFLWLGASNPRKGFEIVQLAADLWVRNVTPEVRGKTQMILKTQRSDGRQDVEEIKIYAPGKRHEPAFRLIVDTRRVDDEELLNIYAGSHCFMLPSFGEGWGLTLCEAQATGLPCIYTPWSGPQDFMKPSFGYPVKYRLIDQKAVIPKADGTTEIEHTGKAAMADPNDVAHKMGLIYSNYQTALRKGRQGSSYLHRRFTWDTAGGKLVEILRKHYGR